MLLEGFSLLKSLPVPKLNTFKFITYYLLIYNRYVYSFIFRICERIMIQFSNHRKFISKETFVFQIVNEKKISL